MTPTRAGLVASVALLALAPAGAAHAQLGQRSMMVSDDGTTRDFVAFAQPDMDLLVAPDVDARDVPVATRILRLSDDQAAVFATLVDAYLERIAGIAWNRALAERGPTERPDERGDAAGEVDPRAAIEGVLRDAGIDPGRVRGGDLQLSIGVGISQSADDAGVESEPELSVSVELGPREGVEISAAERATLAEVANRIAETIERIELARLERRAAAGGAAVGDAGDAAPTMAETRERVAAMHATIADYRRERARAFAEFRANAQAILAEPQVAHWPELERALRRRHTLPWGVLAGERLDVPALAGKALGESEASEDVANLLVAHELELDAALQARNPLLATVDADIDLALIARDAARVVRVQDALIDACVRVRDASLRALDALAATEAERFGPVRDAAIAEAFPMVERRGLAEQAFDALDAMPELDPDLRESLAAMRRAWEIERGEAEASAVRAVLRHEPDRRRAAVRGVVEMLDPERAARLDPGPDLEAEALGRLAALDRRTLRTVRGMVAPEIAARLPAAPDEDDAAPARAERTTGGAP